MLARAEITEERVLFKDALAVQKAQPPVDTLIVMVAGGNEVEAGQEAAKRQR